MPKILSDKKSHNLRSSTFLLTHSQFSGPLHHHNTAAPDYFLLSSPDYIFTALPVGGASPGSSCDRPTVGRNRAIVFGWHTSPHISDAPANPVWETILHVQVTCTPFIQRHHAMHSNVQQGFRFY